MNVSSVAVSGPSIAAVVAGVLALIGVAWNQYRARQVARRKDFAQALTAVERYAEQTYRVLRRQDSTPEVRGRTAEFIHEVQQDLLFHKSWIRIQAPRVADVYDSLLRATREEAGSAITEAWNTKPSSKDEDMPFGMGLSFLRMAEERVKYVQAVSYELEFLPLRLIKDYIVPRVIELLNRKNSGQLLRSRGQ